MDFIDPKLEEYALNHTSKESDVLYELNRKTHTDVLQPRMLSGHLQGRFLSMISKMIQPKKILEIGTYTGYSALCFAEGMPNDGKLITIDINEELEDFCTDYFEKAKKSKQIEMIVGDALEIIPKLDHIFDLVFIDADKVNYINYFNLILDKVKSGGYLIADNVLWSGKVLSENESNDPDTKALKEFNQIVQNDDRVENILLPLRDGLMMIRKK